MHIHSYLKQLSIKQLNKFKPKAEEDGFRYTKQENFLHNLGSKYSNISFPPSYAQGIEIKETIQVFEKDKKGKVINPNKYFTVWIDNLSSIHSGGY